MLLQAEGDEPAVIEPAEAVLEPVVQGPEDERPLDQAPAPQDPGEEIGRRLGQQRAVDVDEGGGRGRSRKSGQVVTAPSRRRRPTGRSGRPGPGPRHGSAASAITRTIGSVLLDRTWTQRSGQSSRRPSRRSASASG